MSCKMTVSEFVIIGANYFRDCNPSRLVSILPKLVTIHVDSSKLCESCSLCSLNLVINCVECQCECRVKSNMSQAVPASASGLRAVYPSSLVPSRLQPAPIESDLVLFQCRQSKIMLENEKMVIERAKTSLDSSLSDCRKITLELEQKYSTLERDKVATDSRLSSCNKVMMRDLAIKTSLLHQVTILESKLSIMNLSCTQKSNSQQSTIDQLTKDLAEAKLLYQTELEEKTRLQQQGELLKQLQDKLETQIDSLRKDLELGTQAQELGKIYHNETVNSLEGKLESTHESLRKCQEKVSGQGAKLNSFGSQIVYCQNRSLELSGENEFLKSKLQNLQDKAPAPSAFSPTSFPTFSNPKTNNGLMFKGYLLKYEDNGIIDIVRCIECLLDLNVTDFHADSMFNIVLASKCWNQSLNSNLSVILNPQYLKTLDANLIWPGSVGICFLMLSLFLIGYLLHKKCRKSSERPSMNIPLLDLMNQPVIIANQAAPLQAVNPVPIPQALANHGQAQVANPLVQQLAQLLANLPIGAPLQQMQAPFHDIQL